MPDDAKQPAATGSYSYAKGMPMWLKVVLYLVIGGVIYYVAYMAWQAKHPSSGNPYNATGTTGTSTAPGAGGVGGSLYNY